MLSSKHWKLLLVMLIIASASVQIASAGQVVITGPEVCRDTYVQGTTGSGDPNSTLVAFGYWSYYYTPNRGLISFDLGAVPSGMMVTSATLRLYHTNNVGISGQIPGSYINTTNYYRLNVPWDVNTARWFYSDWDEGSQTGTRWNGAGPVNDGVTAEVDPTATVDVAIGLAAPINYWVDVDVTADAQYFYNNPSLNHGWLIIGDEHNTHQIGGNTFGRCWRACSSQHATVSLRPQLVVDYASVPGSIAGKVTLQNFVGYDDGLASVAVRIDLIQNGSILSTERVILDAAGNYTIDGVPPGEYNVAFKASTWLKQVKTNVSVSSGETTPCDVTLPCGDIAGDNEVTSTDLSTVLKNMNMEGDW